MDRVAILAANDATVSEGENKEVIGPWKLLPH